MWIQGRLSRIMDHGLDVPPSMPMVFQVRSYVRTAQMSPLYWDWDGGRIASQALDELDYPAAE